MSQKTIKVCHGKSCSEHFSPYILARLEGDKEFYGYGDAIIIEKCTCQDRCKESPTVVFDGAVMTRMNPVRASEELHKRVSQWKKQHLI